MNIPQMEPWFDDKEATAVYSYMKSGGWLMEFKKTEELEHMLSEFTGTKHTIMTVNGTVSLMVGLMALGLKRGDEILVPDFTMIASPNSATILGIDPILVDIDPSTLCMDLNQAEKLITKKTKALMYVAMNGRSGDMKKVVEFCKSHNLYLVEDSAQALGSYWQNKHLGSFGEIGSFSFSVPKVITTGQGGALITNDDNLAFKIRKIKDFGRVKGGIDVHDELGWNFKYTDLQAVIGIEQMKKLPARLERKKEIYKKYVAGLQNLPQIEFIPTNLEDTSPWFIDIFVANPDKLASFLKERGIGTRKVYPPIHNQKVYQAKYKGESFPVTEEYTSKGLWLPSSSKLTDEEVNTVVDNIQKYYHN